jgi:Flp pilus assembly protein TadG
MSLEKISHSNAQALVEFALIMPLLVLLLMGIIDLGRGVYAYNVLASSAREGARFGILDPSNTSGIQTQAKANTVALASSAITVTVDCSNNGTTFTSAPCSASNAYLRVTVTYTFQPVTFIIPSVTLNGRSMMAIEP